MDEDVDDVFVEYCRTCFKQITDENSTKIFDKTSTYSKKLHEMLKFTLTEINLNVYRNASVCYECQKNLEISYNFIKNWLNIDEKYFYWAKYHLINVCVRREHDYTNTTLTIPTKTLSDVEIIDHNDKIIDLTGNDDISIVINDNNDNNIIENNNNNNTNTVKILKKKRPKTLLQTLTLDGVIVKHRQRMQPNKRLCEICGKSCLPHLLNKHLKSHDKINDIKPADQIAQCHICGKQIKQRALLGHLRYTHGDNVLQHYQCEYCGKTFLLRARYRKHLLVHDTIQQYPCDICGKILKYKHSLENHKNFYHGNAKYICDQCPRSYCQSKDLKRHKFRVHELHLPLYRTRKTINTNNNFMRITDDGCYECVKCLKLFTKRTNCWIHIRRHDRIFECDLCQKTLKSRFTLKRHYQIFHLDYCHYYCRCCGKRYYKQIELQNHMLRIHHENIDDNNQLFVN